VYIVHTVDDGFIIFYGFLATPESWLVIMLVVMVADLSVDDFGAYYYKTDRHDKFIQISICCFCTPPVIHKYAIC